MALVILIAGIDLIAEWEYVRSGIYISNDGSL